MLFMFLKKIKMHGFKSFARPVTLDFTSPLTAIVGPNGSGKSNIVDAVRWVMGEQSPTVLRGGRMADVIFSGSDSSRPMQQARVSLQLDNSEDILPLEEDEVSITREVDRSGQGSYYLNGEACRLKDIEEVLYDTGLNRETYSIVGQNRVEAIIKSRPEKLRELFEEAAGITRYRSRKEEAGRKLERTSRDLERVNDLILEIKKRLDPLESEAEEARKYKKLYDRLKELEGSYLCSRLEKIEDEKQALKEQERELEERKKKLSQELEEARQQRNELQEQFAEKEQQLKDLEEQTYSLKTRKQEIKNNLEILTERESNLDQEEERVEQEIEQLKDSQSKLFQELQQVYSRDQQINLRIEEQNFLLEEILQALENLHREKVILSERRGSCSREEAAARINDIENNLLTLKERKESFERDKSRLEKEIQEIEREIERFQSRKSELKNELNRKNSRLENLQQEIDGLKDKEENLQQEEQQAREKIDRLQQAYSRYRSRWQAQKKMQQEGEGYYQGVRSVLNCSELTGIIGPVAELLEVPEKYESAIAAALGSRLQNLVVESDRDAQRAIKYLKDKRAGRATFLPLDMIEGRPMNPDRYDLDSHSGFIGRGIGLVSLPEKLESIGDYLLGRVLVAGELAAATELARKTGKKFKVVTLEGDIINPGGSITGGSQRSKSSALLARSRKIKDLARAGKKSRRQLHEKKSELEELKNRGSKLTARLEEKLKEKQKHAQEINSIEASLESRREELKGRQEKLSEIKQEYQNVLAAEKEVSARQEHYRERREYFQELSREQEIKAERFDSLIEKLEKRASQLLTALQEEEVKLARLEEQQTSLEREIEDRQQRKQELEEREESLQQERQSCQQRRQDLKERRSQLKERRRTTALELEEVKNKQSSVSNEAEVLKKSVAEAVNELERLEELENEIQEAEHSLQLREGKLQAREDRITGRLQDKYDLSPAEARKEFSATESEEDPAEEISRLEKKIRSMGEVNLGAIREYEKLKERHDFLFQEREDLNQARESIQGVIAEIEEKMGRLFHETFLQVNEEFNRIFQQLFSGGEARLKLTDEEDLLATGVEISARPPGKNLSRLTLLSGGEKALTAIALIFAFLNVKPSPVYVLDEIDSPLDEATLHMFSNFIRNYLKESQFILVTHRKQMMAVADTIYGVTMAENGISKLISLQLEEEQKKMAEEMAEEVAN